MKIVLLEASKPMLEVIFAISLSLIVYTYVGYPALLYCLVIFVNKPVRKGPICPSVTIIIAVYNEEQKIKEKIDNTLNSFYPPEKREIIVVSDGSNDRTNEIVQGYKDRGVVLVSVPERKGKEYAQGEAIKISYGEILIFSDAATKLTANSMGEIVSNFNDPDVGCVSGEDRILSGSVGHNGESVYVRYEMLLRRLESQIHSIVGVSGAFFAIRRELSQDWSPFHASDFLAVITAVKKGYRVVSDPAALGFYKTVVSDKDEFYRKVRTVLRGITVALSQVDVFNPFKYGLFSIQLISHKLLRWIVPFFMAIAFGINVILFEERSVYGFLLVGQVIFYCLAILRYSTSTLTRSVVFKIPAFLTLVNIAILVAWIKYFMGERAVLWERSRR